MRRDEVPGEYHSLEVQSLATTLDGLGVWVIVESASSFGDPDERGFTISDLPPGPHLRVTLAVRREDAGVAGPFAVLDELRPGPRRVSWHFEMGSAFASLPGAAAGVKLAGAKLTELRDGILYARAPSLVAEAGLSDLRAMASVARAASVEEAQVSAEAVAMGTAVQRRRTGAILLGCLALWIGVVLVVALCLRR